MIGVTINGQKRELPEEMTLSELLKYLEIEDRMREFSRKVGIPIEELDLLFWSKQTGYVFK